MPLVTVKAGGVQCKSDYGLVCDNAVLLFSVYGSPQQVKALFALLAEGHALTVTREDSPKQAEIRRIPAQDQMGIRFRGSSLGYGKQHALIWDDSIRNHIFWLRPEDRDAAILAALSKRRIPILPEWAPDLAKALHTDLRIATPLPGWGGAGGYWCAWDDDRICAFLVERMMGGTAARMKGKKALPVAA